LVEFTGSRQGQSVAHALQAIDLLVMLEQPIPFDAQTAFSRAGEKDKADSEDIRALATRLGFDLPE
jgi:hypothetical protein